MFEIVLTRFTGEEGDPLQHAMGKVRALGWQSALIYPISRSAKRAPFFSRLPREKTVVSSLT